MLFRDRKTSRKRDGISLNGGTITLQWEDLFLWIHWHKRIIYGHLLLLVETESLMPEN